MAEQIKISSPETFSPETGSSTEQISNPEQIKPSSESTTPAQDQVASPVVPKESSNPPGFHQAQKVADIEHILEEDLQEIYTKLSPANKEQFRIAGEKAARDINTLLESATASLKKIVDIITNWLKIIPGVSKYFLEQEAKIKADRLYKLKDHS